MLAVWPEVNGETAYIKFDLGMKSACSLDGFVKVSWSALITVLQVYRNLDWAGKLKEPVTNEFELEVFLANSVVNAL